MLAHAGDSGYGSDSDVIVIQLRAAKVNKIKNCADCSAFEAGCLSEMRNTHSRTISANTPCDGHHRRHLRSIPDKSPVYPCA